MDYTFVSKYARWIPEKKRRETWNEAVDRVKQMMLEKYADKPEALPEIEWAYEQMRKKKVLGSQRALQFGGSPIFKHNARMYNCIVSFCDRTRFFQECMYLLKLYKLGQYFDKFLLNLEIELGYQQHNQVDSKYLDLQ